MQRLRVLSVLLLLFFVAELCWAQDFPYRKDYPELSFIDLTTLRAGYEDGSIILVDVRVPIEYDTIHAKNAINVPLSNQNFIANLKAVASEYPGKKIAVYCNGITCLKSYHAAQQAKEAGMTNVYAFDAGIPAWAKAYPSDTLLIGKVVTDPEKQIISKSEFKKYCLDFATFKKKVAETPNAVVIDARDAMQRTKKLPGFEDAMPIPLGKLIRNVVMKDHMKDKTLFVFDQVGKQVDWLQYYLVNQGYTNYYFLDGGATSVLKEQVYR